MKCLVHCAPLTAGYYGTRIATHMDAPKIDIIFIESDDGLGPFGAKSMGESSKISAPAAVANAIFNATGEFLTLKVMAARTSSAHTFVTQPFGTRRTES